MKKLIAIVAVVAIFASFSATALAACPLQDAIGCPGSSLSTGNSLRQSLLKKFASQYGGLFSNSGNICAGNSCVNNSYDCAGTAPSCTNGSQPSCANSASPINSLLQQLLTGRR